MHGEGDGSPGVCAGKPGCHCHSSSGLWQQPSEIPSYAGLQEAIVLWSRFQPADPTRNYDVGWVLSTQPSLSPVVAK